MNKEIAAAALQFLGRCNIQGNEAPAFMQVVGTLQAIATRPDAPPIQSEPEVIVANDAPEK